jgi:hypothetical protein
VLGVEASGVAALLGDQVPEAVEVGRGGLGRQAAVAAVKSRWQDIQREVAEERV